MDLIKENGINDLIFGLGMYGAMSQGTINMMRRLATNNGVPKDKKPVKEPKPKKVAKPVKNDSIKEN